MIEDVLSMHEVQQQINSHLTSILGRNDLCSTHWLGAIAENRCFGNTLIFRINKAKPFSG